MLPTTILYYLGPIENRSQNRPQATKASKASKTTKPQPPAPPVNRFDRNAKSKEQKYAEDVLSLHEAYQVND